MNYEGGANGGTITNCAHLTGTGQTQRVVGGAGDTPLFPNVLAVNLTACDTQVIGAHTCTPGTVGCDWKNGDMVSWGQVDWGDDPASKCGSPGCHVGLVERLRRCGAGDAAGHRLRRSRLPVEQLGLLFGGLRVSNPFLNTALGGGSTGGYAYDELYAIGEKSAVRSAAAP